MGNTLGLTKAMSFKKIDKLGKQLFKTSGLRFTKRNDVSIATAGTYSNAVGYATGVAIGVKDLKYASDERFRISKRNVEVSDDVFARIILNMYHEKSHCYQKNELFRQSHFNVQEENNQLVQEIACRASDEYYEGCSNYRFNASEIRAERDGIVGAYKYLCNEFPDVNEKEHERIILNIVNDKMMNLSYFVKQSKPFTSLQEVEDAFDNAYDNSFMQKRRFIMEREPKDPVKIFMNDHEDAKEMYCTESIAVKQDKYIAAIALKLHPEWLDAYPALQDMDLSYENVLANPYREREERKNHALNARKEEIEKILHSPVKPVNVPVQKRCDERDLKNLSRLERLERLEKKVSHLMPDETSTKDADDEYEK